MGSTLLRILVSLAFLCLFAWSFRGNYAGVAAALGGTDGAALAAGFCLALTAGVLTAWRLCLVFKAQGLTLPFKEAVQLTFIGLFFNNFLPSAVGGDLVKAYCASLQTGKRMESFSACLMDRILGLFMFILIPSIAVLFLLKELDPMVPKMVVAALLAACAGLWVIFNKEHIARLSFFIRPFKKIPGYSQVHGLYHAMHEITRDKWLVIRICAASAAAQLLGIFAVGWIIHALSATVALRQLVIRTPLVHLFGMLPSFGGLGLREQGFQYFYKPLIGQENAGALAILYLFYLIVLSAIGGIVYLVRQDYHFNFKNLRAA